VLDEIYTYVGKKALRYYVFTAYGITDLGYVVRFAKVFEHVSARSLERFLLRLPPALHYFSDGAPMYGTLLGNKVLQEKNVWTNLVESFNSQLRQYVTALRRKTKAYAKVPAALERQLALVQLNHQWLKPSKI
jgi:IS1 family transposase